MPTLEDFTSLEISKDLQVTSTMFQSLPKTYFSPFMLFKRRVVTFSLTCCGDDRNALLLQEFLDIVFKLP